MRTPRVRECAQPHPSVSGLQVCMSGLSVPGGARFASLHVPHPGCPHLVVPGLQVCRLACPACPGGVSFAVRSSHRRPAFEYTSAQARPATLRRPDLTPPGDAQARHWRVLPVPPGHAAGVLRTATWHWSDAGGMCSFCKPDTGRMPPQGCQHANLTPAGGGNFFRRRVTS